MNVIKLTSPDYVFGKSLLLAKSLVDIVISFILKPSTQTVKINWLILKVKPRYTMVSNHQLRLLYELVHRANRLDVPGDIVECGVWHGGSAAIMAVAQKKSIRRHRSIWLFDSFEGLPPPGENDGRRERDNYFVGWNKGSIAKINQIFNRIGIPRSQLKIVPGWFDQTLAKTDINQIAILHIDADWYESVKIVLNFFYDMVAPGGFIVLDDYGLWPGCTKALDDFLSERKIKNISVHRSDRAGAYLQKPMSAS